MLYTLAEAGDMTTTIKRVSLVVFLTSVGFTQDLPSGSVEDPAHPTPHYAVFFVSAEAYKNMNLLSRRAYITGWLDARLNGGRFGTQKTIAALIDCLKGKTLDQITAIVDKYVASHPEEWHLAATWAADTAIDESVCPIPW